MSQIEESSRLLWRIHRMSTIQSVALSLSLQRQRLLASISSVKRLVLNPRSRPLLEDKSGDRLRDWLGVDEDTFYNSGYFAVLPMDFYFPGHGKSGDLPPRAGFAEKWHPQLLQELPDIQLTLLIGQYAQAYYLQEKVSGKVTERVKHYQNYLPAYFPLVHPSPRNQIWMAKNPWFESEVVPDLKKRIKTIL